MSVRCTPFCLPCDKGYKHHELLLALLNTRDVENGLSEDKDHEMLKAVINRNKSQGWDINTEILEVNVEFRFPLLHWACVLGKTRTVRWLLESGFSPTVQTKDTLETCVHRALMTLPDLTSTKSGRLSVLRFETILPYLRDCLCVGDHRLNTPLHIAAQFMVQHKCYSLYENLFLAMLTEIMKMPNLTERLKCLNAQNASGDTVLNLLASGCKSIMVMEKLLGAGADSMLTNKLSIGPIDNAQRHGLVHIENFLKSSLLRGCGVPNVNSPKNLLNEDSRKRRSERRSTYYSTKGSNGIFNQLSRTDANGLLDKSLESPKTHSLSSPSKSSVNSSKSIELDENDTVNVVDTEDEECSSQSSLNSDTFLPRLGEDSRLRDDETDRSPTVLQQSTTTTTPQIKSDNDHEEMCQCCGDDNINNNSIPTAADTTDQAESEVRLFDVMKKAGVLPNFADVITRTKDEHLGRMREIEKSIVETNGKQTKSSEKEKSIEKEIEKKKLEIEKLNAELYEMRKQKVSLSNKRKLMEEESQDLRKKLVCCETLLNTVPKDTCR